MIKDLSPPSEAEEYRNTAEILRDLAAHTRFGKTRNELLTCADTLERLAACAEHQSEAIVHSGAKLVQFLRSRARGMT